MKRPAGQDFIGTNHEVMAYILRIEKRIEELEAAEKKAFWAAAEYFGRNGEGVPIKRIWNSYLTKKEK